MDKALTPGYQTKLLTYMSSDNHQLIGTGNSDRMLTNIGADGSNLTIAVLMMNRSSLTVRLMDSVKKIMPDFAGEFLIGDNGSSKSERELVKKHFSDMPFKCRCVEFGQNYGVSGGRNRLYREVKTEWIFQLDNDVYFISNPLKKIQKDISVLGCHFLCVPVLNEKNHEAFVYGGHLYVETGRNDINIGGGSAFIADSVTVLDEHEPFLCTFLSGCSSILNRDTFFKYDGYDEGMFVGFEDTEYSLRLFRAGMKIGSCGLASVIHDHPKPLIEDDREYERQRFSVARLEKAARHFEQKHGFRVWNPMTENWVRERLNELLDEKHEDDSGDATALRQRPGILLVIDKPGWALDNIARQIIRHCSDVFEFRILYLTDVDNVHAVFLAGADCALIHFLWRSWLADFNTEYSRGYASRWGMDPEAFYQKYIRDKTVCTSVYDHLFLDDDFTYSQRLFSDADTPVKAYSVSSGLLKRIYDADERIHIKPEAVIADGVDLELFRPWNEERFRNRKSGERLTVGWAGNSMWSAEKEDFKGLHTLLKPVIEELAEEGYPVELRLCDSHEKTVPHEEMPDFYNHIDLYVCMSKIEGTPNPILECMACGVPFISTDVGIVSEAAGERQSEFILRERSRACLKEALIRMLKTPSLFQELSEENLESIREWDWSIRARRFVSMWKKAINIQ